MVHEWALAESIILYVENKNVSRVKKLSVKIGILQSIDREILEFAIRELSKERGVVIDNVEIIEEKPVLKCNVCNYTWSINPSEIDEPIREAIHFIPESIYAYFKCPNCGSIDFEVVKGRGLSEIMVEKHEQ